MIADEDRCEAYRQKWTRSKRSIRGGYWKRIRCRNRARFHVVAPSFDERLCGTHAGPWRRDQQWATYRQGGSILVTRIASDAKAKE